MKKNLFQGKNHLFRILNIPFILFILCSVSCSCKDPNKKMIQRSTEPIEMKKDVSLQGNIVIIGAEPFTLVALRGEDGNTYELTGNDTPLLRNKQGRKVKLTGDITGKRGLRKGIVFLIKKYEILK